MHAQRKGCLSKIKGVGFVGFFAALGLAAISTIWAIYLESILHNPSYVGFLTSAFILVGTLTYIIGIPFLEKTRKIRSYAAILFLMFISFSLFSFISNIYAVIILGFIVTIIGSLRISLYGLIVRDKSKDKDLSKNEGMIYSLLNLAFLIAPIGAGYLASKIGIKYVFVFASIFFLISFVLISIFKIKDNRTNKKIDKKPFRVFLDYFKNKNRVFSYFLGGGIDFWWVLIYIYVPIHLFDKGLGAEIIGYFLAAIIIPLVLIESKIGKIVNKKGFKKIFLIGFVILGFSALVCFFISNIYFILGILILSSIGAAMVEPTTEAYSFDIIGKKEMDRFYPIYNTTINVSSIFARVLGAILLLLLPFDFIYLFFAGTMFLIAFLSTKTKEILESKKG